MSNDSDQISLFRSQIKNRRFNDTTLGILESLLVTQDVKSALVVSFKLREFLRFESLCVIREIAEKSVEEKLLVIEFFVRAFALAGDNESCLALRYEALVMRELRSSSDPGLEVSFVEWLTFAEHSLENRSYAIAKKACEKALSCFEISDKSYMEGDNYDENVQVIKRIRRLKDIAVISATSHSGKSVQAQAAEYMKKKSESSTNSVLVIKEKLHSARTLFRNGIKKHNLRKLQKHQKLAKSTTSHTRFRTFRFSTLSCLFSAF